MDLEIIIKTISQTKINLIMIEVNMVETVTLIEILKTMEIIQDLIRIDRVEIMEDLTIEIDKVEIQDLAETDH